jgi:hypothetical protein
MDRAPEPYAGWTFLTNHSRVLAAIAEDHTMRVRDIALRCRLTERAVQKIIADLEEGGYLTRAREGRSNVYRIAPDRLLRHPADAPATVAELLSILVRHESEHPGSSAGQHDGQRTGPHDGQAAGQHDGRHDGQHDGPPAGPRAGHYDGQHGGLFDGRRSEQRAGPHGGQRSEQRDRQRTEQRDRQRSEQRDRQRTEQRDRRRTEQRDGQPSRGR